MGKFIVKSGRIARFERGKRVEYRPSQVVELSDEEARKFAALVAPVPAAEPAQPAFRRGPVIRRTGD